MGLSSDSHEFSSFEEILMRGSTWPQFQLLDKPFKHFKIKNKTRLIRYLSVREAYD